MKKFILYNKHIMIIISQDYEIFYYLVKVMFINANT